MNIVKLDQLARRLPDLIATLSPGEEIIIVDGHVALAKVTAPTIADQMTLSSADATDAADESVDDFARNMT
jgi:antitoxin (DNA-binding transcriptional repressor) of toxin-antitoxin stability system